MRFSFQFLDFHEYQTICTTYAHIYATFNAINPDHSTRTDKISVTRGRFFVHFFRGKFRGKFRRKFSPKNVGKKLNFPRKKMYEKSAPDRAKFRLLGDRLLWAIF
jgi:hypothetical protein